MMQSRLHILDRSVGILTTWRREGASNTHSPRKKSVAERGSPILYNFWLMLERSIASNQNRQAERSHIFGLTPNLLGLQLVSTSCRDVDMTQRHLVPHIRLATHF
jgi:hypothetical protein